MRPLLRAVSPSRLSPGDLYEKALAAMVETERVRGMLRELNRAIRDSSRLIVESRVLLARVGSALQGDGILAKLQDQRIMMRDMGCADAQVRCEELHRTH